MIPRTRFHVILLALNALALLSARTHAQTASLVGTQTDLTAWRTASVDKPFDSDGDDVIGTLGYHLFGAAGERSTPASGANGPLASLPSSITVTRNAGSEVQYSYASIDNPVDNAPAAILSGTTSGSGGGAQKIATVHFGAGVPSTLTMTLMHDNLDGSPGQYNVSGYQIRAADGTSVLATIDASNDNNSPDWHGFNLAGLASGDQVQVWGTGGGYPTLGGIAFDVVTLPPVVDDSAATELLGFVDIPVLQNDKPTGTVTLVEVVDEPASGAAVVQGDNSIRYTHTTGTPSSDSFTYRYTDDNGPSALGTVTVTLTSTPDPVTIESVILNDAASGPGGTLDATALGLTDYGWILFHQRGVAPVDGAASSQVAWDMHLNTTAQPTFVTGLTPGAGIVSSGGYDGYTTAIIDSVSYNTGLLHTPSGQGGENELFRITLSAGVPTDFSFNVLVDNSNGGQFASTSLRMEGTGGASASETVAFRNAVADVVSFNIGNASAGAELILHGNGALAGVGGVFFSTPVVGPPPPTPEVPDPPSYVWQVDFQGEAGGAFGSAAPVDCDADLGDGATWNPFEIEATNDKVFSDPPNHNAVVNPELLDLLDSNGNPAGINLRIVDDPGNPGTPSAVSPYNSGGILALGGADAAFGDHWFFGAQGSTTSDIFFQFENLPQGSYELTAYANPSPHNPPRDFSVTVGATTVPINPTFVSNPSYADAGSFEGTIDDIAVGDDGLLAGSFGTIGGDPSLAAVVLRLIVGDDGGAMNYGGKYAIPVLANDNPTGDVTLVEIVTGPASGTAVVQPDGTILYTHTMGTPEGDSFTYRYTDDNGVSQTGTVRITFTTGERILPTTVDLPSVAPTGTLSIVDAFEARADFTFEQGTGLATIRGNSRRFFVAEKDGIVWEIPDIGSATPTRRVFMDFTDPAWKASQGGQLDFYTEMGIKGLAFHPDFETGSPYVYVSYNFEAGAPSSGVGSVRLSRFTVDDGGAGVADMLSEQLLIDLDSSARDHNIDGVKFGPDGYLYVGFGDEQNPTANAQTITNELWSSILRIDIDRLAGNLEPNPASFVMTDGGGQAYYRIPADNPYAATSGTVEYNGNSYAFDAVRSEIHVTGVRNPWRFSFDTIDGQPVIWHGDIGSGGTASREEVNILRRGDNAGWRIREGGDRTQVFTNGDGQAVTGVSGTIYQPAPAGTVLRDPEWFFARGSGEYEGASIIGGYVTKSGRYAELDGAYIFGDWLNGHIWALRRGTVEGEPEVRRIGGLAGVVDFIEDPSNGDILVLSWNSQSGGSFDPDGQVGRLYRIRQNAASNDTLPLLLSQTGIFADLSDLTPNPGVVAYDPAVTFWSDKALKRRWVAVPEGTIGFSVDDPWTYPEGTVFVKHFDMEMRKGDPTSLKRLETRVIRKKAGGVYGVSYRWNEEGSDAVLVDDDGVSFDLEIDDDADIGTPPVTQTWTVPSRTQCIACHTGNAGWVLGFNTRQLNHSAGPMFGQFGNQLDLLDQFGMLDGYTGTASSLPAHARIEDPTASVDARARAYLDVNCAYCHRNDGGFNLRADVSLAEMNVLGHPDTGQIVSSNPDLERVRMGHPGDSSVLQRAMASPGFNRMPPIGSALIDKAGVELITAWIQQLDPAQPLDNEDVVNLALKGPGGTFTGESDPSVTGIDQDPDADGIANGIEVLLGLDPNARDQVQVLGHGIIEDAGARYFEVELVLSDDFADQLAWKIRLSDDMVTWADSPAEAVTVGVSGGKRTVRIRDSQPLGAGPPRRFYRLSLDAADVP